MFDYFRAEEVILLDSKTIVLKYFTYDGRAGDNIYFWVGNGPQVRYYADLRMTIIIDCSSNSHRIADLCIPKFLNS